MKPTFLDLFAGAGGFSCGMSQAGFKCRGAVEVDSFAAATYRQNFSEHVLYQDDIRFLSKKRIKSEFQDVDVIIAGPPCQGFSVAGLKQYGLFDKRNNLLLETLRVVGIINPSFFVVENVKGILNGHLSFKRDALSHFIKQAKDLKYQCSVIKLQAADFGVPQWRERIFIIGSKKCLVDDSLFESEKVMEWTRVVDALSDLPQLDAGEQCEDATPYNNKPKSEFQSEIRKASIGVFNHIAMKHTDRVVERFKRIPIGGSLVDAPKSFGQRLRNGTKLDVKQRFKMNNQKLNPFKVSTAITASFQSNFVHYRSNRNLTAREGARLQSFPDSFIFKGPRTLMSKSLLRKENRSSEIGLSQYNQIGNAVPPFLARAVGRVLLKVMK